jgi:hypothetical protein
LSKSEKLQDLLDLGSDLVDTLDSDDKGDFSLRRNEEVSVVSGNSFLIDKSCFFLFISLMVFFRFVFPFLSAGFNECFSLSSFFG